jgi:regulatory protein
VTKILDQSFSKAKQYSFKLLKIRARSSQELKERLRQKHFSLDIVQKLSAELNRLGLLNDTKFAQEWVAWRLNNAYGKHRIIAELKQKGIAEPLIAKTLATALIDYSEETVAFSLAHKRAQRYSNLDTPTRQRRIFEFLARKGFSQNIALKIAHSYDDQ